ncbi:MAG: YbaB/EbfC family nucleoid-associated protein [Candidatus Gastranaerophilales bacterium]|nr:YbaB/EbfC family nucleoid-associated protein [Candidatus Gastranaerophilales bacterium]
MMNMMQVMQQAQKMQKRFKETQGELEKAEVISTAGNGAVTAVLNGQGKFKAIKLTAEAINPENPSSVDTDTIEMLEDLLTQALSDATKKATEQMESKMKAITGGISIPGLF